MTFFIVLCTFHVLLCANESTLRIDSHEVDLYVIVFQYQGLIQDDSFTLDTFIDDILLKFISS